LSRSRTIIVAVIAGIVGVAVIAALAYAFLRPTEEATAPIEAISINTPEPAASDSEEGAGTDETTGSDESAAESGGEAAAGSEEAVEVEATSETDTEATPKSAPVLYEILQSESEARFKIDEVLRGNPKTVVGVTDQVAGEILFNPDDPSSTQIGTILVNARTLATDDDRRNRAIGNQILDTGAYEFISFSPTEIIGLPDEVSVGDNVSFQIKGDLTIRDVTNEVTFDATVTVVSEDRLVGTATATVLKEDYGLTIPNVPFVANVGEEVVLEIDFVAAPVS
jgi:polyisoprenoid-binding protein YceI